MAQKKKTLHINPFDDLCIVALTTPLKDYKMAWHLNESLRLNLKKMAGFVMNETDPSPFSFYYYDAGENLNVFNLLQLQSEGMRLLKFSVPVDFLLIIRNTIPEGKQEEWISIIRKIPGLTHAFVLDIEKNKQLDPLLELIELHEFTQLRDSLLKRQSLNK